VDARNPVPTGVATVSCRKRKVAVMPDIDAKVAMVAGGSGMVGSLLLQELAAAPDIARIYAITRRPLGLEDAKIANRIVQFDKVESQLKGLTCQFAFCCVGTTIRDAGSQAEFRRVDVDAVLAYARAARAGQAQRFILVSSVGADRGSKNFYLRVKGETEAALEAMGFPALDILQPGLLTGVRKDARPLEAIGRLMMPLVNPLLTGTRADYRGIPAQTVAQAMIGAARSGRRGVYRYTYAGIAALAASRAPRRG